MTDKTMMPDYLRIASKIVNDDARKPSYLRLTDQTTRTIAAELERMYNIGRATQPGAPGEKMPEVTDAEPVTWRPIDSAPKDGTDILLLLWWPRQPTCIVASFNDENPEFPWMTLDGPNYATGAPTHWMPLPPPPASSSSGGGGVR